MWVVSQWGALAKPWGAFAIRDGGSGELLQSHGAFAIRDGGALTSPIGKTYHCNCCHATRKHTNARIQINSLLFISRGWAPVGSDKSEVPVPGRGSRGGLPPSPEPTRLPGGLRSL